MKMRIYFIGIILSILVLYVQQSFCCTSFYLRVHKKIIIGFNIDCKENYGYWMINKRNVKKTAILPNDDKPASFAYRVEINWWVFVLAGRIALLIALATVVFKLPKLQQQILLNL